MRKLIFLATFLLVVPALPAQPAQRKSGKVFISVDMEGIWGVVHANQTSSSSPEYNSARKWMAEDVNAVVDGLFQAGAVEIVVNDSHGSMRNIVADALNPKVSLITGSPKPLSMMQGIDSSFEACIFIGYHSQAGTTPAILDHTISGGTIHRIRVNEQELPELGLNGAIAGYFNVPVIMLSGDAETASQAQRILGAELVTAVVKEATGRQAARLYPAEEARKRLKEAAIESYRKRDKVPPFVLRAPLAFEVEFNTSAQAEVPMLLPQVKKVNARTVTFRSNDYLEGFRLLRAIIALAGTIS